MLFRSDLTPEKFDLVKDQLIEAGITRDDILEVWFIPSCLLNSMELNLI